MSKGIVTGIDIGSSKITTLIVNIDEENISVLGVASYKSSGIKKGVIVNIDDAVHSISESLEAAERMAGIRVSNAYVSLGCKHISSTNNKGVVAVSNDEISYDDISRVRESSVAVSIPQSREVLHTIAREYVVDSQGGIKDPIGMAGIRLEMDTHIITVSSMVLHNLKKCVSQVGLSVVDIIFSGWADAEIILTQTEKDLGVVLLDIGFGVTDIAVYHDDAIAFSGSIPIGSSNITNDLAIGLRLTIEDAEKIKCNYPILIKKAQQREEKEDKEKKYSKKDISSLIMKDDLILKLTDIGIESDSNFDEVRKSMIDEIIEARIEEIFVSVRTEIEKSGFDSKMPAGIVLTGGGSKLYSISKLAQRFFSTSARVGYPTKYSALNDEISGPSFSTVQGIVNHGEESLSKDKVQNSVSSKDFSNKAKGIIEWVKNLIP